MGHNIRDWGAHEGVPISQDYNVADGEQVYIGNGQGCGTFWFRDTQEAKRFIDAYRERIKVTDLGCVTGLIPKALCEGCRGHYSHGTPKWKRAKDWNCHGFKEQLKEAAGIERQGR